MIDEETKNIIAVCDFYFLQEDGERFKVIKLIYFDIDDRNKKKRLFLAFNFINIGKMVLYHKVTAFLLDILSISSISLYRSTSFI